MNIIKLKNPIKNDEIKNKKKFVPIDPDDNIRLYNTILMCAPRGYGKTNAAINLLKYMQERNLIINDGIYIITTTFDNNNFEDYLHLENENVFTNIQDTQDLNDALNIIDDEVSEKVSKWKDVRAQYTKPQYEKLYKTIYKKHLYYEYSKTNNECDEDDLIKLKPTDDEYDILNDNKYAIKQTYYDVIPSFVLLLDDIQGIMCEAKKSPLTNIMIRHRHKHISIIILTQTLKNALPKSCRANIVYFCIWHFNDEDVNKALYNEIGKSYFKSYEEFMNVYNYCTSNNKYDFLMIDTLDKNKSVRKNFDEIIKIN